MSFKPKELTSAGRTFLIPSRDLCLHIIKTGYSQSNRYLVVHEDAYQQKAGLTEMMSSKEIKEVFNIDL
tara:strand:- start:12603 stop:12809 length:207 start_codon:yes stop_codon:yes gene_type:complete